MQKFKIHIITLALTILTCAGNVLAFTLTPEQQIKFEGAVQHFCFTTHNLLTRAGKDRDSQTFLSETNEKVVAKAQELLKEIDIIRSSYVVDDHNTAFEQYSKIILPLCYDYNIRRTWLSGFQDTFPENLELDEKLEYLNDATKALCAYYDSIKPQPSLFEQTKNLLLYNWFSTFIVPKLVRAGGLATSSWLLTKQITAPSRFNALYRYEKIEHNARVPSQPGFFDRLANALHRNNNPGNNNPNNIHLIQPCQNIIRDRDGNIIHDDGHVCGNTDGQPCYVNCGFETNPARLAAKATWYTRFTTPFFLSRYLADFLYEYQKPVYESRVKNREKQTEQARIEKELKTLKTNYEREIDFTNIKGQRKLIDNELRMVVDYLKHPLKYNNGGRLSVLFYGPPGTGKTLLARAIAKESEAPFVEITADDILHETSRDRILAAWKRAELLALERPQKSAIIYIDEIDCVVGNRKNGPLDPMRAKSLSNMLAILDGIEKRNPYLNIVIIIATNHHKNLDPALTRPGRIDRKVLIDLPDTDGRTEFFTDLLPANCKALTPTLVAETAGFSGAEIKNLIANATMVGNYNHRQTPHEGDFKRALELMKMQKSDLTKE